MATHPPPDLEAAFGPEDSPHLPRMVAAGATLSPQAPTSLRATGVDPAVLADLALKLAYTAAQFTSEWAATRLCLPLPLIHELTEQLRGDRLLEVLGQAGPLNYRYAISQRGRERAARLLEISGYVGPAPVSLPSYAALLAWQVARFPRVSPEAVAAALGGLVLAADAVQVATLAVSSGRSLFVFGPPGNGKTTMGRMLHDALQGDLWVPHCIAIDGNMIRVFDPQWHRPADPAPEPAGPFDHRWVRVRRPLIILGTDITLDSFELTYSPGLRSYEAPLHFKANGGTLMIDDFGRERLDPRELLNRWITPLEEQTDYLTLQTGQKVRVPVRHLLVIATNLDPATVMDPAFLRRMGYRLLLGQPTPERYAAIFEAYAARGQVAVSPGLVGRVLDRYRAEGRDLRGCEPRDLIERARDICSLRGQPPQLTDEVLDLTWRGYFGNA
jgi:hypothetical protein